MSCPCLALNDLIFRNAGALEIEVPDLHTGPILTDLMTQIGDWFRVLDPLQATQEVRRLRFYLFQLRATLTVSLLPFQFPLEMLRPCADQLARLARDVPSLSDRWPALRDLMDSLPHEENPKHTALRRLVDHNGDHQRPVAVITPASAFPLPDWSGHGLHQIRSYFPDIILIPSRNALLKGTYAEIVIPWGGRRCPFLPEIFASYRSPRITVLRYPFERPQLPQPPILPRLPSLLTGDRHPPLPPRLDSSVAISSPGPLSSDEWSMLRAGHEPTGTTRSSDREFLEEARLLLLANNHKVFLSATGKVIELSEFVEGMADPSTVRRFPRKPVPDLSPGDLILLRTSGSGDYLQAVADQLMRRDGRTDLREKALDWKPALEHALQTHGSRHLVDLLMAKGHTLQSHHNYIWKWTTPQVLRPRSESLFYELIAILEDLGFLGAEALQTAETRWLLMRTLVSYHGRAAAIIRNALLKEVRKILKEGRRIDDALFLSLPGVDAGELGLLRVTAVDPETTLVPYHRIGHLLPIDE